MTRPFLGFSPERFSERRTRVKKALGGGVLLLPSAPVLRRSRDTEVRYRPDSELFYLTGCVDPGVVAVLRADHEEGFVLFVPGRDPKAEVWSGPRMDPSEAKDLYGADKVFSTSELEERLPELLRSGSRVLFRLGVHPALEKLVVEALTWARGRGSRTGDGPRAVADPGTILDELRMVKDSEEISRIRGATELTVAAFEEAMGATRPGMGEWEVESLLEAAFRKGGGTGPAFPTIVGSGENGCTLHYTLNRSRIQQGHLVLLDGGAEVDLYAGDVTRTYPAGGQFTGPQAEVYHWVLRAHRAACEAIGPGAQVSRIHEAALAELVMGLVELGILQGDPGELLEEGAYKPHFPHQTSHWLGLDVHDVGDYATESGPRVLSAGTVLTVEPGLYFPSGSGTAPSALAGIGIRIEDDILVTSEGAENLTEGLPVSPDRVEALNRRELRE
ncbi:MAG: M24 family metallopeptidase [Gemmatimonadetes bacterium]|nr:aminopeptidase P N-terminal domain-containing protein [Gemmatimonadota bacterium]NNM05821.1 M24 family metallopeptidase [Gemmatimonadota bacterium]